LIPPYTATSCAHRDTLEGEAARFVAVFNRKIEALEKIIDEDDEVRLW
jgi:hypothetical protein